MSKESKAYAQNDEEIFNSEMEKWQRCGRKFIACMMFVDDPQN